MRPSPLPRALAAALAALALAACSDAVTLPRGTRLVASLDGAVRPDSVSVGDTVRARLAGDLEGAEGVLVTEGTLLLATVTAVQQPRGQWPSVIRLDFGQAEIGGTRHALPARIVSVEARPADDDGDAAPDAGMSLMGSVLGGRADAALMQEEVARAGGSAVALGGEAPSGYLPDGGRLELEVTARTELPPPGGGG